MWEVVVSERVAARAGDTEAEAEAERHVCPRGHGAHPREGQPRGKQQQEARLGVLLS